MSHVCNSSTSEVEEENPQVQDCCVVRGQPETYGETFGRKTDRQLDMVTYANDLSTQEVDT